MSKLHLGVVEDINDPEQLGRVRVRVYGVHPVNNQQLITEHLPWAPIMMQATSSSVSGLGQSPTGIETGSTVTVMFFDDDMQMPCVIGTFSGFPSKVSDPNTGFSDPHSLLPRWLHESDVNRSARGKDHDQLDSRLNVELGVVKADGSTWDEPSTAWAPEYPKNKVFESVSGHMIEIDDTVSAERILVQHTSGSFVELHPNGDIILKSKGSTYEIIANDKNISVGGDCNITCGGNLNVSSTGPAVVKAATVVIDTAAIELGKGATEPLILGNTFKTFYNAFVTLFNAHVHPTPFGPTLVPTAPATKMSASQLSQDSRNKTL